MNTREIEALINTLQKQLKEGAKYGREISTAYEAGYYIGTIKSVIQFLEENINNK